jgi:hypothetical protein
MRFQTSLNFSVQLFPPLRWHDAIQHFFFCARHPDVVDENRRFHSSAQRRAMMSEMGIFH